MPKPSIEEIAGERGALVKVLRVGVDGTNKETNNADYGAAPDGDDFIAIGHEGLGIVEEVGPRVRELKPGDYVVASVRRPGSSIYDLIGTEGGGPGLDEICGRFQRDPAGRDDLYLGKWDP